MTEDDSVISIDSAFYDFTFADDLYFEKIFADPALHPTLQSELLRYYDYKLSGANRSFLSGILSGKVPDSLLAMSELMRRAALKQLLKQITNGNTAEYFNLDDFSKWLKEILKLQTLSNNGEQIDKMLMDVAADQELLKLWEELVRKSIMEIGLDILKQAITDAMRDAQKMCFNKKKGESPVSSFGNGGELFGIEHQEEFIRQFQKRF
jgi:hypothetical protein